MQKQLAVALGHQTIGIRVATPLATRPNRLYADKLGHGEFHPYNIPPAVLNFFVTERDSCLANLKEIHEPWGYTMKDWMATNEKIEPYKKIKTILDMHIAEDTADATLVLQNASNSIEGTLEELKKQLASIESGMANHKAKCNKLEKAVKAYDKILQKIQEKPR